MATNLHEEFAREYNVTAPSNKRFGLVVGGILLLLGCVRASFHGAIGWFSALLGALGLLLVAVAIVRPYALEGANQAWTRLGVVLHKITNPVILGAMYAVVIVPTGFAMRLFGIDSLHLRGKREDTYLISKTKAGSTQQSLKNPF